MVAAKKDMVPIRAAVLFVCSLKADHKWVQHKGTHSLRAPKIIKACFPRSEVVAWPRRNGLRFLWTEMCHGVFPSNMKRSRCAHDLASQSNLRPIYHGCGKDLQPKSDLDRRQRATCNSRPPASRRLAMRRIAVPKVRSLDECRRIVATPSCREMKLQPQTVSVAELITVHYGLLREGSEAWIMGAFRNPPKGCSTCWSSKALQLCTRAPRHETVCLQCCLASVTHIASGTHLETMFGGWHNAQHSAPKCHTFAGEL